MTSIYQQVLGEEFARLHPRIQQRFGFASEDGVAAIGHGTMDEVWHGPLFTLPFLYLGSQRRILFPERGRTMPFVIENYAYKDRLGRETVTWLRTFHTPRRRQFDAYMLYDPRRHGIVDYLGTHQHLAVDLALAVDERGGLRLVSGEQRVYEGPLAVRCPAWLTGFAEVHEWYDEDAREYRIDVCVANRRWGPLFGYRGRFQVEWRPTGCASIPRSVLPLRTEARP